MILKEKQRNGRRDGRQAGMRVFGRKYRRRRRAGLLLLSVLTVLAVAGVGASAILDGSPLAGSGASVERIDTPRVAAAPEAVDGRAGQQAEASRPSADGPTATRGGQTDAKPDAGRAVGEENPSGKSGSGAGCEKAQEDPAEKRVEGEQQEQANAEPAIPIPATNDLWMSIPKMDLYDDYVANSNDPAALDVGAAKTVESGFPWRDNANTYISAHRLGYPGTASYYQFYDLPNLALGDKIYLGDANGTTYTYEVTGFKEVAPTDTWITAPRAGRDMISLQTCIENYGDYWTMDPNWYVRYVVQADRVSVDPA